VARVQERGEAIKTSAALGDDVRGSLIAIEEALGVVVNAGEERGQASCHAGVTCEGAVLGERQLDAAMAGGQGRQSGDGPKHGG
jgi:hypothetical protein